MTHWSLSIPEKTDRAVRTFLSQNGRSMGDLSEFVNDAVRRRIMELTVIKVKDRNTRYDQSAILEIIDEEIIADRESHS